MAETQSRSRLVRFGAIEADVRMGELRKDDVKLKFSGQPFQVLAILLERPGDVVTWEDCKSVSGRTRLWMSSATSTPPSTISGRSLETRQRERNSWKLFPAGDTIHRAG